jgi:uncharacterized protein YdhG (YjbR/CyaY superfamily)
MQSFKNIDTYIANHPKDIQVLLQQMRTTIQKAAPKATESIKYGMPTFELNGNLIHFAAFKKHMGLYPTPSATTAFKKELAKYKTTKGAIQFPLDEKLPLTLVSAITKFRVKEVTVK